MSKLPLHITKHDSSCWEWSSSGVAQHTTSPYNWVQWHLPYKKRYKKWHLRGRGSKIERREKEVLEINSIV
jgi:hypothetical protein